MNDEWSTDGIVQRSFEPKEMSSIPENFSDKICLNNMETGFIHDHYDDLNDNFSRYLSRVKQLEIENTVLEQTLENHRNHWDVDMEEVGKTKSNEFESIKQTIGNNYDDVCQLMYQLTDCCLSNQRLNNCISFQLELNNHSADKLAKLTQLNKSTLEEFDELNISIYQKNNEIESLRNTYLKNNMYLGELESEYAEHCSRRNFIEMELQMLKNLHQCISCILKVKFQEYNNVFGCLVESTPFYRSELTKAIGKIRSDFAKLDDLQMAEIENYYISSLTEAQSEVEFNQKRMHEAHNKEKHDAMELSNLMEDVKLLNDEKTGLERDKARLVAYEYNLESQIKENLSFRKSDDAECDYQISVLVNQVNEMKMKIGKAREDTVSLKLEMNICKVIQPEEIVNSSVNQDIYVHDPLQKSYPNNLTQFYESNVESEAATEMILSTINYTNKTTNNIEVVICITNCSECEYDMKDWYIRQLIENQFKEVFRFADNCIIKGGSSLSIYSNLADMKQVHDEIKDYIIASNVKNWTCGENIKIQLHKPDGQTACELDQNCQK